MREAGHGEVAGGVLDNEQNCWSSWVTQTDIHLLGCSILCWQGCHSEDRRSKVFLLSMFDGTCGQASSSGFSHCHHPIQPKPDPNQPKPDPPNQPKLDPSQTQPTNPSQPKPALCCDLKRTDPRLLDCEDSDAWSGGGLLTVGERGQ